MAERLRRTAGGDHGRQNNAVHFPSPFAGGFIRAGEMKPAMPDNVIAGFYVPIATIPCFNAFTKLAMNGMTGPSV